MMAPLYPRGSGTGAGDASERAELRKLWVVCQDSPGAGAGAGAGRWF